MNNINKKDIENIVNLAEYFNMELPANLKTALNKWKNSDLDHDDVKLELCKWIVHQRDVGANFFADELWEAPINSMKEFIKNQPTIVKA